ncbi:fused MFS/spermidine synthase [Solimonas flava]|uniref:fused MFS/spermidine synthase n=1 Tax=Solimonas flava TaxID=415849 RepID=UPI0013766C6F|nr:fused MFS/spermidine synthase [Solimonas flava]
MPSRNSPAAEQWLDVPARLLAESGTIRLREPRGSNVSDIVQRLRAGEYDKPFVVDDGKCRRLHFNLDFVQSEMRIDDPYALNFAYTRKMMSFLLFVPRPKHVVLVGLGGGSLSKFCYRQLPKTRVTTIEIDGDVLAFSQLFELPDDEERMRIVHADAADYFATTEERADVVLIDGCDRQGVAPALCSEAFYRDVAARLRPRGMLVMNLIGPAHIAETHLRLVAGAFSGRIWLHKLPVGGNRLLFALKDPRYMPDWSAIQDAAKQLKETHGLDFPAFARQLRHAQQFQFAR